MVTSASSELERCQGVQKGQGDSGGQGVRGGWYLVQISPVKIWKALQLDIFLQDSWTRQG